MLLPHLFSQLGGLHPLLGGLHPLLGGLHLLLGGLVAADGNFCLEKNSFYSELPDIMLAFTNTQIERNTNHSA